MPSRSLKPRTPRRRRDARSEGVALVLVMIFLALMLLLGLATTSMSITEVGAGKNLRLSIDAFNVADAGASHAYELVKNMRGDFTSLLRGTDATLQNGDEFAQHPAQIYNGAALTMTGPATMFDETVVRPIGKQVCADGVGRALVQIDARHYYELVAYDDADDARAYIAASSLESAADPLHRADVDGDQRVVVRSIGYVMRTDVEDPADFSPALAESSAVVDIVVGLTPYPAVVSNDDLMVANAVSITGTLGSVHANDDLVLGSGGINIEESATFSDDDADTPPSGANATADSPYVQGFNGRADALALDDLNPYVYADRCDYVVMAPVPIASSMLPRQALLAKLGAGATQAFTTAGFDALDGTYAYALVSDGAVPPAYTVTRSNVFPWTFVDGAGATAVSVTVKELVGVWSANVTDVPDSVALPARGKSLFVLLPEANSPLSIGATTNGQISLLTNANIHLSAQASLVPSLSITPPLRPAWCRVDVLALAGMDVQLDGTAGVSDSLEGVIYAHEQFALTGSARLVGQVAAKERKLVYDAGTVSYVSDTSATPWSTGGSPVPEHGSVVNGTFQITHSVARGYLGDFAIAAWRQLRDYDARAAGITRP